MGWRNGHSFRHTQWGGQIRTSARPMGPEVVEAGRNVHLLPACPHPRYPPSPAKAPNAGDPLFGAATSSGEIRLSAGRNSPEQLVILSSRGGVGGGALGLGEVGAKLSA